MSSEWPTQLAAQALSAPSRAALLEAAVEHLRRVLDAPMCMIFLGRPSDAHAEQAYAGVRALHVREYQTIWREHDPARRLAFARRAAVRDCEVVRPIACDGFRAGFLQRAGALPYLVAPLYGMDGDVTGALHALRPAVARDFSASDAERATAFAAFLSVMLARPPSAAAPAHKLAAREHQVAMLAARGLSNGAIAGELGIAAETVKQTLRRVYRKTGVVGRTELAARYGRAGLL